MLDISKEIFNENFKRNKNISNEEQCKKYQKNEIRIYLILFNARYF